MFKETTWKTFLIGKIKRLYFPFVGANISYVLLRNILFMLGVSASNKRYYGNNVKEILIKILLFDTVDIMASATWFVFALLVTNLLFLIIYKLTKYYGRIQDSILFSISILLYYFGMCNRNYLNTYTYGNCSICTILLISILFYTIGYLIKKYSIINLIENSGERMQIILVSTGVITLFLSEHYFNYSNDYRSASFSMPVLQLLNTISGFIFLTFIARKIVPVFSSTNNIISWAGRHSIDMLLWHVAWFQLITFIQIKLVGFSLDKMDRWPNLIRVGNWRYLSAFVGISAPLLIRCLYEKYFVKK